MAEKGKKGKGKKDTAALPVLLKSDDVTGEHKKGDIIMMKELPQQYKKAYNNAWNVGSLHMHNGVQYRLCSLFVCT